MVPPMIPPRPKGRTTARIIPQRVDPSASAPSRSPSGACENASRMTEVWVGTTMSATTMPAMNADEVNAPGSVSRVPAASVTSKIGIQPK